MSSTVTFHVGDVRDRMANMPDTSVDLIVTSPPFLALRSYLPADHPDKHREIGSEPTPATYLDTLLELTAEWRRLLTPTGSLCVELGDTYSGSGGAGGDYDPETGLRAGQPAYKGSAARQTNRVTLPDGRTIQSAGISNGQERKGEGWPLAKSLCGIPTLYTWSLAYGRNLLTGNPSPAGQWRIRNLLVWTRPNPPVGALGDKFRPATSYVTVAATSANRWFDLDAVRTEHINDRPQLTNGDKNAGKADGQGHGFTERTVNPAGAPPLDWHHDDTADWQPLHRLPTAPYPGAHYATYPLALPRKLIEAMCPRQVCVVCGEPRRRITGPAEYVDSQTGRVHPGITWASGMVNGRGAHTDKQDGSKIRQAPTLGWTDCGHNRYRPGHVLDPFTGSGTTLLAAALTGRNATGIDIDYRNLWLTLSRLRDAAHVTHNGAVDANPAIWNVDPNLPGLKHEHPDQQSLFSEPT